jgi:hypothetical protein
MTTGGDVVSVRRAASHHGRLEVRCCCQPEKLLGSLPVPDGVREGQTLVYAYLDCQQNGHGKITFKVARWVLDHVRDLDVPGVHGFELDREYGLALKHEGVTLATLRKIRGFVEAHHGR